MQNALRMIIGMLTGFVSPALFALGLGNADVRSYLGQPLDVRVQLISSSQEELNSVSAALASAASMQAMGLTRSVSIPLHFDVHADLDAPYIQVSSRLPVSEPVIQVVVEATWSGGRMLREYTLFLDPPTFSARAPAPLVSSRPVSSQPAAEQAVPEIYPRAETVDVAQQDSPESTAPESTGPRQESRTTPAPIRGESESTEQSQAASVPVPERGEPRQTVTVPSDPVTEEALPVSPAPEVQTARPVAETLAEETGQVQAETGLSEQAVAPGDETGPGLRDPDPGIEPAENSVAGVNTSPEIPEQDRISDVATGEMDSETPEPSDPVPATAGPEGQGFVDNTDSVSTEVPSEPDISGSPADPGSVLGPVEQGETLWGIASRHARSTPYDVNQAMLAIQRLNPDAFGGNNINFLKRGAILRMPAEAEMARLTSRQAMVEAMRQGAEYQAYRSGQPLDSAPPILADNPEAEDVAGAGSDLDQTDLASPQPEVAQAEPRLLQLIPPSEDRDPGESGSGTNAQPTGAVASEDLQEVLARTEEELANAQQENAYLNERIRELEARIDARDSEGAINDGALAELESRLKSERLSSGAETSPASLAPASSEKWYSGKTGWLLGLFLVVIAVLAWLLKRFGGSRGLDPSGSPATGAQLDTVKTMRTDAEELLKTLEEGDPPGDSQSGKDNVISLETYGEPAQKPRPPEAEAEPVTKIAPKPVKPKPPAPNDEEAVELDGDDPETMLDLARAYISMTDHESARKILEEVLEIGSPSQVAEASEMMREL